MNTPIRIGYGCDIHRLVEGRPLYLCGCLIPHNKGLLGHSDADAAVHALIDAMIGALALGDIGHFFPDNDPAYKGASGEFLLKATLAHPAFQDWELGNVDLTIIAQKPKMAPHIMKMRNRLAELLNCPVENVSVKAKTAEKLDSVGAELAIEVRCVVLLYRRNDSAANH